MKSVSIAIVATLFAGTVALAHQGVKDPLVQARMHSMKSAGQASKVLGGMVRGKTEFDAATAQLAKDSLIEIASALPSEFETPAQDPKSEALDVIWSQFDDFTAKADAMKTAAEALDVSSAQSIGAGIGALGGTCRACHKAYRR